MSILGLNAPLALPWQNGSRTECPIPTDCVEKVRLARNGRVGVGRRRGIFCAVAKL